jgi:ribosomal subunit interface protein
VAVGQAENLLAAVDVAVDKMEQQLRKHKEKVQDRHRGAGPRP